MVEAETGVMKRRTTAITKGWDDTVNNITFKHMMAKVITKVHQDDPAQGSWCITGEEVNTWVDANSLATGVVLDRHGAILEDAC